MMDNKLKHLEFIQQAIARMAANSFLIKGWTITLVSALFALAAKDANVRYIAIAYLPVPVFWLLDGYYLWQERLFRALYDRIRVTPPESIDFSMKTDDFVGGKNAWSRCILSRALLIFYPSLIAMMLVIMYFIT